MCLTSIYDVIIKDGGVYQVLSSLRLKKKIQWQRDLNNVLSSLYLQFVYECDPIQLTFLRLLSNHAKQSITYHCLNSTAWFKQRSGNYDYSIKLKAENGIEIHAKGTRKYKPTIVLDECKVRIIAIHFRPQEYSNGFALLRSVIGLKISRHFLSQSDAKPKPIRRYFVTRFPALGAGYVYLVRVL